jgi:hypothetical protein
VKEKDGNMRRYRFIRFAKHPDMVTKDRLGVLERAGDIRLEHKDAMWETIMMHFNRKNTQKKQEVTSG